MRVAIAPQFLSTVEGPGAAPSELHVLRDGVSTPHSESDSPLLIGGGAQVPNPLPAPPAVHPHHPKKVVSKRGVKKGASPRAADLSVAANGYAKDGTNNPECSLAPIALLGSQRPPLSSSASAANLLGESTGSDSALIACFYDAAGSSPSSCLTSPRRGAANGGQGSASCLEDGAETAASQSAREQLSLAASDSSPPQSAAFGVRPSQRVTARSSLSIQPLGGVALASIIAPAGGGNNAATEASASTRQMRPHFLLNTQGSLNGSLVLTSRSAELGALPSTRGAAPPFPRFFHQQSVQLQSVDGGSTSAAAMSRRSTFFNSSQSVLQLDGTAEERSVLSTLGVDSLAGSPMHATRLLSHHAPRDEPLFMGGNDAMSSELPTPCYDAPWGGVVVMLRAGASKSAAASEAGDGIEDMIDMQSFTSTVHEGK